jgi:hypothetical protein
VQNVQLLKGRQDSRRSRSSYKPFLECEIIKHLISKYKGRYIVIENDPYCYYDVEDLDVDLNFLKIVFGDFKRVTVNKFGLHVAY